ncbi:LysE family transporter [Streptomyces sp. NPDC048269]|uniref:LysE family transporter n=1 Tax=Streptomyces sp. NPDC048269 TaxID=3155753 RepID=UPI003436DAA7
MSELMTPALAGAVAGLGVAMPMGAMSVLLLQEAMRHRRAAIAAAAGIAAVDLGYAALATALGPWVASHISPIEAWVRLTSAVILLAIAARGLTRHRRHPDHSPPPHRPAPRRSGRGGPGRSPGHPARLRLPAPPDQPAPPAFEARGPARSPGSGTGADARPTGGADPAKAFARYVGLTALNPTTALYFAALTTAQGATLRTGPAGAAFLLGVGAASLLWQQSLVALGALAGSRISDTARAWTFRLGYGLVAAYAIKIALPLP